MSALLKLVPNEKRCSKCGEVKLVENFYRMKSGKLRSSCKECWNADTKARAEKQRIENPDAGVLYARKRRQKIYEDPELHRKELERKAAWNKSDKYYDNYYMKRFGIPFAEVNSMLAIQGGRCSNLGCSRKIAIHPTGEQKKAIVDHNHDTKKVRSMMCQRCNTTLGHVENSQEVVLGLFDYLNKYNN